MCILWASMEEGARDGEPPYNVRNYWDVNDSKYNLTDLKKRIFCLRYVKKSVNKAGLRQEGAGAQLMPSRFTFYPFLGSIFWTDFLPDNFVALSVPFKL